MRMFRKIVFWLRLIVGLTVGLVVLTMSVTGVLLAYEKQITRWADTRGYDARPPATGAPRLPIETLIARVREQRPDLNVGTVTMRADTDAPVSVAAGRDDMVYVNAYTGAVLGSGSPEVRGFFRSVTDWHRWLAMAGEQRTVGRAITGFSNLFFLGLVVSGFYLWWPRTWTWQKVRSVTWFKRGLPGKARDFNWHNTIGFWSAVPLFVIVASGVVMSYPWANALVYRMVGEDPPVQGRGPGGPGGAGAGQAREARGGGGERAAADAAPVASVGLDALWARAQEQNPAWTTITLRVPNSPTAPAMFTIDGGDAGQPQYRTQVTIDSNTGNVVKTEAFSSYTRGRQLRTFLRFAHTGEYFGLTGQTIAGLVSLGACFLVYTGVALALRRLVRWWRATPKTVPSSSPAGVGVQSLLPNEIQARQATNE